MSLVREDHDVLLSPVIVSVFVNFIYRESHEKFLQNEKLEGLKKQKAKKKNMAPCARDFSRALK